MPKKRELLTGQRFGDLLIIMEIEKRNSRGRFDVIVYCGACKTVKRRQKQCYMGTNMPLHCGCKSRKRFGQTLNRHVMSSVRPHIPQEVPRLEKRYGRSLRGIR